MYRKLKAMRIQSDVSVQTICELLGYEGNYTYYRRENQSVDFKVEEAKKLVELFKVPFEELFQS